MKSSDWSGANGDTWARRWRDTDRALVGLSFALDVAIREAAPSEAFKALDVGCGAGSTSLVLAEHRPDAAILGCDLSQSLIAVARQRPHRDAAVSFIVQDAERAAREHGPFALIFSRHGVMFFDNPGGAFATFRAAASDGARLVFSCFQDWHANPWAAELASAAAGRVLPSPGHEPGGFAFADPAYVRGFLQAAGWAEAEARAVAFEYVAGEGPAAADQALGFLSELGPASRVIQDLDDGAREAAVERMRAVVSAHERDGQVLFPAAAWIWKAAAR